jgi:hypothetical protein
MWATQCHKPTICGWFESQNGDDLGMVYGLGFTTLYNLLHPSLTYSHEKTWFQFQSYPVLPTISWRRSAIRLAKSTMTLRHIEATSRWWSLSIESFGPCQVECLRNISTSRQNGMFLVSTWFSVGSFENQLQVIPVDCTNRNIFKNNYCIRSLQLASASFAS